MLTSSLWKHEQAKDNEGTDHRRRERSAKRKAAVIHWLIEKIANRGAEGTRKDECRPK